MITDKPSPVPARFEVRELLRLQAAGQLDREQVLAAHRTFGSSSTSGSSSDFGSSSYSTEVMNTSTLIGLLDLVSLLQQHSI